jgi:hypothetical protein
MHLVGYLYKDSRTYHTKDDWGQLKAVYNFQNMYPAIIML